MSQSEKAIVKMIRDSVASVKTGPARAELLRIIRRIEAGCHLTPDGKPL